MKEIITTLIPILFLVFAATITLQQVQYPQNTHQRLTQNATDQPSTLAATTTQPLGPSGTWNMIFSDEFDGTSVNTTKWTDKSSSQSHLMQGNKSNGQLEWNQMANCNVQNGLLTLTANRETVNKSGVTYDWTSCLLTTGSAFTFQYGYIEIRSRQPACGSGMWPAFWTWQAPGANSQREVDVYEYWPSWSGRCAKYTSGTHGNGIGGSNQGVFDYPTGTTAQQFNVYGADIRPDGITYYLNGQPTRTISNSPDGPMSIIVNLAVWADVPPPPTSNGAIKEVDYIRAWQKTSNANPPTQPTPAATLITPTIYCVGGTGGGPCATIAPTYAMQPSITGGANVTLPPIGGTNPTSGAGNPNPTTTPCAIDSTSGIMHNKDKHKKKFKENKGGLIEQFFKFLLKLIEWLISGGQFPVPNPNPNPSPSPVPTGNPVPTGQPQPTINPCPEPSTVPQPTTQPTIQPTSAPTIGIISPTSVAQPTTIPTTSPTTSNAQLPANILNLANWKLQLPIGQEEKPTEIKQPALATYKNAEYFTVVNGGVRFRAPVNGVTTSGSLYPRSELREMTNNGATQASWSTTTGTHTMFLDQAITAVPATKKHVVAGQIHDGDSDVIVTRLEYPKLYINIGGQTGPTLDANYTLGKRFTVKFEAKGGKINIYYNGSTTPSHTLNKNISTAYFKAGAYTQSNCTREASNLCKATNYGEVIIYKAEVTHQ